MELYATNNEIKTFFTEYSDGKKFCEARLNIHGRYDVCPFCVQPVKEGAILLLLNNGKLFPNIIVHKSCCDNFSKEDAVRYLHEDYQEALKLKHWFNID